MRTRWAWCLAFLGVVAGCAALPPRPEGAIGHIEVRGPNATMNGSPATHRAWIRSGDHVATGPGTTLTVYLLGGGSIQLDENTDPTIQQAWDKAVAGTCTIVEVVFGRVFLSGSHICLHYGPVVAVIGSQVALDLRAGRSALIVLEGHVEIRTPIVTELRRNQGLFISDARADARTLAPEEAQHAGDWRLRFRSALDKALEKAAEDAVKPHPVPEPQANGWCCIGNSSVNMTPAGCEARHGTFTVDRNPACKVR